MPAHANPVEWLTFFIVLIQSCVSFYVLEDAHKRRTVIYKNEEKFQDKGILKLAKVDVRSERFRVLQQLIILFILVACLYLAPPEISNARMPPQAYVLMTTLWAVSFLIAINGLWECWDRKTY